MGGMQWREGEETAEAGGVEEGTIKAAAGEGDRVSNNRSLQ